MAAPSTLNLPSGDATVIVRAIDSVDPAKSFIPAALFLGPIPSGRELMFFPDYAFLVENPRLGRRVMFDLGTRDLKTYPPSVQTMLEQPGVNFVVNEVPDQLVKGNIDLASVDAVIWSHTHVDHVGDVTKFPPSTELVVGRGTNLSAYPDNAASGLREEDVRGRKVKEVSYTDALKIGEFDAFDFFGDGSFYLLDCPGHVRGHTCALARVTPTAFIFLGGDICHHPGEFRPSALLHRNFPCPGHILEAANKEVSTEHFGASGASKAAFDLSKRGEPMLGVVEGIVHEDIVDTRKAIQRLLPFDADSDILVVIAHDATLIGKLPLFPETLNDWKKEGLKEKVVWDSFDPGSPAFRYSGEYSGNAPAVL
ncbi:beta-lactamase-like protein [Schizophyllum fasciatum]